jgi:hypothetical protein
VTGLTGGSVTKTDPFIDDAVPQCLWHLANAAKVGTPVTSVLLAFAPTMIFDHNDTTGRVDVGGLGDAAYAYPPGQSVVKSPGAELWIKTNGLAARIWTAPVDPAILKDSGKTRAWASQSLALNEAIARLVILRVAPAGPPTSGTRPAVTPPTASGTGPSESAVPLPANMHTGRATLSVSGAVKLRLTLFHFGYRFGYMEWRDDSEHRLFLSAPGDAASGKTWAGMSVELDLLSAADGTQDSFGSYHGECTVTYDEISAARVAGSLDCAGVKGSSGSGSTITYRGTFEAYP